MIHQTIKITQHIFLLQHITSIKILNLIISSKKKEHHQFVNPALHFSHNRNQNENF